jgi:hypothetical protein
MPWQRRAAPGASTDPAQVNPDPAAPSPDSASAGPDPAPAGSASASPDSVSPDLLAWAQAVDATQLSEKTAKQAERYLRDYRHMNFLARREYGLRLRTAVEYQVRPPPPASIAALDIAATVLSARRRQLGIE